MENVYILLVILLIVGLLIWFGAPSLTSYPYTTRQMEDGYQPSNGNGYSNGNSYYVDNGSYADNGYYNGSSAVDNGYYVSNGSATIEPFPGETTYGQDWEWRSPWGYSSRYGGWPYNWYYYWYQRNYPWYRRNYNRDSNRYWEDRRRYYNNGN